MIHENVNETYNCVTLILSNIFVHSDGKETELTIKNNQVIMLESCETNVHYVPWGFVLERLCTRRHSIHTFNLYLLNIHIPVEEITFSFSSSSVRELPHNSVTDSRTSLCLAIIFSAYFCPSSKPGEKEGLKPFLRSNP